MKKYFVIIISVSFGFVLGLVVPSIPSWFEKNDLACLDGTQPDKNGCCDGELYTDMGDLGYNCCPESGGDCFPPIK